MKGFIIEYVHNGWPEYEIQKDVSTPMFDKDKEVLSIWDFEDDKECQKTLRELRAYRLTQTRRNENG